MQNRNDNISTPGPTGQGVSQLDPLTRRELGHYARQQEIGRFLSNAVKWLGATYRGWIDRTRQYQELNALPDYVLKDIGFTRDQISQVLNNQFKRPEMSLSPTGPSSAPAFSPGVNDTEEDTPQGTPKAA